jgi:hypothetical protein
MEDETKTKTKTPQKPWWAPDAQGFLAGGIVLICGLALFVRMFSTSTVDDKMLDTMITILFSTCLVTVYNFSFGSSRGQEARDDTQNKIVEKLTTPPNGNGSAAVAAAAEAAAPAAAAVAAPAAAAVAAPPAVDAELDRRGITDPTTEPKT